MADLMFPPMNLKIGQVAVKLPAPEESSFPSWTMYLSIGLLLTSRFLKTWSNTSNVGLLRFPVTASTTYLTLTYLASVEPVLFETPTAMLASFLEFKLWKHVPLRAVPLTLRGADTSILLFLVLR